MKNIYDVGVAIGAMQEKIRVIEPELLRAHEDINKLIEAVNKQAARIISLEAIVSGSRKAN